MTKDLIRELAASLTLLLFLLALLHWAELLSAGAIR